MKIGEIQGTSFCDSDLPDEYTTYTYNVAAVDLAGNEGLQSASVDEYIDSLGQPPDPVTGVTAATLSHEEIEVSWTASTEPDLDHYNVYRNEMKVAEVAETETTFTDTNLEPETTYSYTVSAVDDDGNEGPQSSSDLATTDPEPEPGPLEPDGTDPAISVKTRKKADDGLTAAASFLLTYWTGWWPLLHIHANNPETSNEILHMAVDLLGFTTIYNSDSMGTNEEDYNNAMLVGEYMFVVGLWIYALIITCAVVDKAVTGLAGAVALASVMLITMAIAYSGAKFLVDNDKWSAGSAAWGFVVLTIACVGIAFGLKTVGGIGMGILLRFLGFIMGTSFEAAKAAIVFTSWTRLVFILMALGFLYLRSLFLDYGG